MHKELIQTIQSIKSSLLKYFYSSMCYIRSIFEFYFVYLYSKIKIIQSQKRNKFFGKKRRNLKEKKKEQKK